MPIKIQNLYMFQILVSEYRNRPGHYSYSAIRASWEEMNKSSDESDIAELRNLERVAFERYNRLKYRSPAFIPVNFYDNSVMIILSANTVVTYEYLMFGLLLGLNRRVSLVEFLTLAPQYVMYIGGTQQKVSKHVIECLRNQYKMKKTGSGSISDATSTDSDAIRLEAITLLKIRASVSTMKEIESSVIKAVCVTFYFRMYLPQIFNLSTDASGGDNWQPMKEWSLYAAAMFIKTDDIYPTVHKKKFEAKQNAKYDHQIEEMDNEDPDYRVLN